MRGYNRGIEWVMVPAARKAQLVRIMRLLKGRKCVVDIRYGKYHSLLRIYH